MPHKQPPYVQRQRTRHGKTVYYFRRNHGRKIRLPHLGSPEFGEAYRAALVGGEVPSPIKTKAKLGSLSWLVSQYRGSASYLCLSIATRRQRDNIFRNVEKSAGAEPYAKIDRRVITASRDRRADTPAQARNFLDAMRGLFQWAVESGFVQENPTAGVRNPKRPKGMGFPAWTLDDVAAYESRWPEGSKERVWLHVLLYTGLRRGDAVRIGKQHVRDGVATIKQTEKNDMEVTIPLRQELIDTLSIGPTADLAWICGARGEPLTKETFGNQFRKACRAAGVDKSAHGLRKLAATLDAEARMTVAELEALYGWKGGTMASHYTRTANRKNLALQAVRKRAK